MKNSRSKVCAFLLILFITSNLSTLVKAVGKYDEGFYSSNDILYYDPDASLSTCTPSAGSSSPSEGSPNGNTDYKGRKIIPDEQVTKVKSYQKVYENATKTTKIPWQVFAVIHIRESNLSKENPANGQGIYQDLNKVGNDGKDYTPGEITDQEFLRQTENAGKILREKAGSSIDLVEKGDPEAIKDMFFGYNGRAAVYTKQAKELGFDKGYEGSPYVMNKADEKRDPDVNKTTWKQIKVDNDAASLGPANADYGAFIMYSALTGAPKSTGECQGGPGSDPRVGANGWPVTGPNAMTIYYQDEEPWKNKMYGPHTIQSWGCGPTATAMAIATLNKDTSVNPENMSAFFVQSGYQTPDNGTSWAAWAPNNALSQRYKVSITELGTDMSKAAEALKRGSFVVISADGCPFACAGGHILLFRGVRGDGKFLVADPNKNWGEDPSTSVSESNKTMNDQGYTVTSAAVNGIRNMWEIRK